MTVLSQLILISVGSLTRWGLWQPIDIFDPQFYYRAVVN
jgi:hypothetical protein